MVVIELMCDFFKFSKGQLWFLRSSWFSDSCLNKKNEFLLMKEYGL